jgi:hypothetical protein
MCLAKDTRLGNKKLIVQKNRRMLEMEKEQ